MQTAGGRARPGRYGGSWKLRLWLNVTGNLHLSLLLRFVNANGFAGTEAVAGAGAEAGDEAGAGAVSYN